MSEPINFHLPFSMQTLALNICFADVLKDRPELFRDNVRIASYFGGFPVKWGGGRLVTGPFFPAKARAVIEAFNERGIPFRFTFTNPLITEEDLGDKECNWLLKTADNGMNEVLVVSEVLEEHIRKNYPRMGISSSTCKCIRNMDDVKKELAKDYKLVVLDYNFNNNYAELEKLTPEERARCEVLSNPVCVEACPRRAKHYEYIGDIMKNRLDDVHDPINPDGTYKIEEWDCEYRKEKLFGKKTALWIEPDDIFGKLIPMGFRHFKIEGRMTNMALMCEYIVNYMAKPEKKDEARYNILGQVFDNIQLSYM